MISSHVFCGPNWWSIFGFIDAVAVCAAFDTRMSATRSKSGSLWIAGRVYFLLVWIFVLLANAISTRRRIATEREGLSGCFFAQSSIADLKGNESRIADTGSCPVAGRPRFFRTTGIDFVGIIVLRKRRAGEKLQLPTSPNPSHGGYPWRRLILFLAQVAN
jgi:hypothetical protein